MSFSVVSFEATVEAGNTYVDVAHELGYAPRGSYVLVTSHSDLGGVTYWLGTVDAVNIRVEVNSAMLDAAKFGVTVIVMDLFAVLTDSLSVAELKVNKSSKLFVDGLVYSDLHYGVMAIRTSLIDAILFADVTIRKAGKNFVDSVTYTDRTVKNFWKRLTDSLSNSDSIAGLLTLSKILTDSLSVADLTVKKLSKRFVDSLVNSDSTVKTLLGAGLAVITDAISIASSTVKGLSHRVTDLLAVSGDTKLNTRKVIADSIVISASVFAEAFGLLSQIVSDILSLSDSRQNTLSKVLSDVASLSTVVKKTSNKTVTEYVSAGEAVKVAFRKILSDAVAIADSVVAWLPDTWHGIIITLNLKQRKTQLETVKRTVQLYLKRRRNNLKVRDV